MNRLSKEDALRVAYNVDQYFDLICRDRGANPSKERIDGMVHIVTRARIEGMPYVDEVVKRNRQGIVDVLEKGCGLGKRYILTRMVLPFALGWITCLAVYNLIQ